MTFKMSEQAQTIKIFNLRSDTNEFIGAGDAYIPPHTGLPANCTDIALLIFPPVILLYLTLKPRHGVCMRITAARWFTTQQPAIRFISPLLVRCPKMSHQFHQVVNTRNGMVRLRSG